MESIDNENLLSTAVQPAAQTYAATHAPFVGILLQWK